MLPMRPALPLSAVAALLVFTAPPRLAAQAVPAEPLALTPICAPGAVPALDSTSATVAISAAVAWNSHLFTPADRARMQFHADAIRQHFTPPRSLGTLAVLAESPDGGWGGARSDHSAVAGKLVLVLKPNGRLRDAFWQLLPSSSTFAAAVFLAARAADAAHEFETIPGDRIQRSDDTVVVQVRSTVAPPLADELPLMRVRIARYLATVQAERTSSSPLFFPMHSDDGMVENEGEMLVIVGTDGRAVMSASQVTRVEVPSFLRLMQRAVASSTYEPAVSGGCLVPSVVIERFKLSSDR